MYIHWPSGFGTFHQRVFSQLQMNVHTEGSPGIKKSTLDEIFQDNSVRISLFIPVLSAINKLPEIAAHLET